MDLPTLSQFCLKTFLLFMKFHEIDMKKLKYFMECVKILEKHVVSRQKNYRYWGVSGFMDLGRIRRRRNAEKLE